MILSGKEILNQIAYGNITITPLNYSQLNPNSYNLRLADELLVYDTDIIDMNKDNPFKKIKIPEEGLVLYPGTLYLGRTVEFTETHNFLPCLEGRSSIGRLGIAIHITAGFGDAGFAGTWTLEISVIQPVRIYPNTEICQIYYQEIKGDIKEYHGRYQNQTDIATSRFYLGNNYSSLDKELN